MITCRICGDQKPEKEFYCLPGFSKWKKKVWCRGCQRLWLDWKKVENQDERLEIAKEKLEEKCRIASFSVSFQ